MGELSTWTRKRADGSAGLAALPRLRHEGARALPQLHEERHGGTWPPP